MAAFSPRPTTTLLLLEPVLFLLPHPVALRAEILDYQATHIQAEDQPLLITRPVFAVLARLTFPANHNASR